MPRYEIGLTMNGVRFVLHSGHVFPPYPTHDMISAARKAVKTAFPKAAVTQFQEYGGEPYSY